MAAGLIMEGEVDERDIREVDPGDLVGFERCHFFSGICGWELALEIAGWDGPVWTGSCPCQPFSTAGGQGGADDERHLWPEFSRLISACRPPVVFGEQVDAGVREWLDEVADDFYAMGYEFAAAVLPAAVLGAPHIRHRLWFVAECGANAYNRDYAPHRTRDYQNLHEVWRPEKPDRVLSRKTSKERSALCVQGVRPPTQDSLFDRPFPGGTPTAEGVAQEAQDDRVGIRSALEAEAFRDGAHRARPRKGETVGPAVRPDGTPSGIAGEDRRRKVRTVGRQSETGGGENGHKRIARQDQSEEGLRLREREGDLLRPELRNEQLGRGGVAGDSEALAQASGGMTDEPNSEAGGASSSEAGAYGQTAIQSEQEHNRVSRRPNGPDSPCAGAPHIRQRLWWVADSPGSRREGGENAGAGGRDAEKGPRGFQSERGREAGSVADAEGGAAWHPGFPWEAAEALECADGKIRLVEPGIFPLAPSVPGRVGQIRAYGNSIVPPLAAVFIKSYMEAVK